MKITVSGSLGNIGHHLVNTLVQSGNQVTVISSSEGRRAAIEALGATAAIGSVSDAGFLKDAFTGADAVFAMTPPNMGGTSIIKNTAAAGHAYAEAIKQTGVKRVVMLSSIGADVAQGTGPIAGLYPIEQEYSTLEGVNVTFLRAGFFYNNFYNDIPLIKNAGITGANYPGDALIPLVSPADIAAAAAEELVQQGSGKNVRYIISDVRTPNEVAQVFGAAIGKPELPWVEFTDEQYLGGMTGAGVPEEIAGLYTEMGTAFRSGVIPADFRAQGSPVTGKVKLEDFAKDFAAKF
ncbi:NAD-dependent dehydratase [Flavobacterium akiainvivens]|uniref:NAD-dependent dehydratase n=1 Tax=Flavobacterium akiainvivens TaxID=1202724 RepID=A0A0M9VJ66_9FLAO|nr:NmrA family NAD(P)-binding protein [Flavobacterium akiainvivens]KOS07410.1 NAD-dependent dehydratase [Flavobacterium akiainvivens]SFQ47814.1 Uncharacterized conserved protein YbjT, contains NAD(P)-binding and DUF2867 domains [Flavobacterium akiainvivens]